MRCYLGFPLLAYCTCGCLLLPAFLHPESGQDVFRTHFFQRSEESSLAEAYISIGSACDDLRPNMYRDPMQMVSLVHLFTHPSEGRNTMIGNADVRKGGQKILNNVQGT